MCCIEVAINQKTQKQKIHLVISLNYQYLSYNSYVHRKENKQEVGPIDYIR